MRLFLQKKKELIIYVGKSCHDCKEVIETMKEVVDLGVEIFTIGQYQQPTKNHLPVNRYVEDEEFQMYNKIGLDLGFRVVESCARVKSSYHADEQARLAKIEK